MYFALSPACEGADRVPCLKNPDLIKVIHYSSEPKPWARHLDSELGALSEERWIIEMKKNFKGHKAWVLKDPYHIQGEAERETSVMHLCPDGKLRRVLWDKDAGPPAAAAAGDPRPADLWSDHHHEQKPAGQEPQVAAAAAESGVQQVAQAAAQVAQETSNAVTLTGDAQTASQASPQTEAAVAAAAVAAGDEAPPPPQLRTEAGQPLGEVMEADSESVQGAELVMELAVKEWDEAYRALAAKLGESNLAEAVKLAVKGSSAKIARSAAGDDSEPAPAANDATPEWKKVAGWWLEKPIAGRAVASCSLLPTPRVILSFDGKSLLAVPGPGGTSVASAEGLHLAAVSEDAACPAPQSFASTEVAAAVEWVGRVPTDTIVLLALNDADGARVGGLLHALVNSGLGCPAAAPPPGYAAVTAIGRKGTKTWSSTHAASEVALSTFFEQPSAT